MEQIFKDEIKNKELKEHVADMALGILEKAGKISKTRADMIHTKIEYAYLLKNEKKIATLLKVIKNNGEVYYLGSQDNKLMILNEKFTEELFVNTRDTMLQMHKVTKTKEDEKYYFMELY